MWFTKKTFNEDSSGGKEVGWGQEWPAPNAETCRGRGGGRWLWSVLWVRKKKKSFRIHNIAPGLRPPGDTLHASVGKGKIKVVDKSHRMNYIMNMKDQGRSLKPKRFRASYRIFQKLQESTCTSLTVIKTSRCGMPFNLSQTSTICQHRSSSLLVI